jgi:hypothetical protein
LLQYGSVFQHSSLPGVKERKGVGVMKRRFMESLHANIGAHWDHEPLSVASFISNELRVRFMERENVRSHNASNELATFD